MNNQPSIHSFSNGAFTWFEGVIENIHDPLKHGRVQVRAIGYHTSDKALIPTAHLPWAHLSLDVTNAGSSGVGKAPTGIKQGSTVWGFFRDGANAQDPVICGVIAAAPQEPPNTSRGFNDPDGQYPRSDAVGDSDVNKLARGVQSDAYRNAKSDPVRADTAEGGTWSEPTSPYNAKYPYNAVSESESGHIHEVDDTEGAERIHTMHKTGTFQEYHPNGDLVTKIVTDNYTIVAGDDYVYVEGNCNITVNGNAGIKVNGNSTLNTTGNHTVEIGGNLSVNAKGTATIESGGMMAFKAPRIDLN